MVELWRYTSLFQNQIWNLYWGLDEGKLTSNQYVLQLSPAFRRHTRLFMILILNSMLCFSLMCSDWCHSVVFSCQMGQHCGLSRTRATSTVPQIQVCLISYTLWCSWSTYIGGNTNKGCFCVFAPSPPFTPTPPLSAPAPLSCSSLLLLLLLCLLLLLLLLLLLPLLLLSPALSCFCSCSCSCSSCVCHSKLISIVYLHCSKSQ